MSESNAQFTVVTGRRRIGKTALVWKAYEAETILYFFVARKAESDLCGDYLLEIENKLGLPTLGKVEHFSEIFEYLMKLSVTRPITLFIDEFHVVYENEYSANFFNSAWRQFRKRNTHPCAITQNVEYLLDSVQASTMLSNSEFVVMLNQAASDRAKLAELLNISTEQMSYITNADAGCGLMKYGASLVPFVNKFPKNTELYRLITTKPGEGVMGGAVNGISNN